MIECASVISEVCVYPGQAQVVRRGKVELPAGTPEVLLPDLPLSLLPETVRVAGRGTAQVRLLGIEVNRARYEQPPEEAVLELDRRIEQLEDLDRSLGLQVETLNHRLEVLASLGQAAAERMPWGISRGTADVAGAEGLLAFVHKAEGAAREEIRQIEVKRRDLGRKLERLLRERDDRKQPRTPDRYALRVPLEVVQGGDLEVEVTYVCSGATWRPLYDLRLEEEPQGGPQIALGQLAEVSQQTGEDWMGVKLSVSTARPALAANLPRFSPWYIDLYRPSPPLERRLRAAAAPAAALSVGAEPAAPPTLEAQAPAPVAVPAAVAEAEVHSAGAAVVFLAPGTPSIPADGSPHKIFLGSCGLPAPLDWVTAPKAETHVYRRAKVQNTSGSVLLPGRGSIFYGETYIGATVVPETPPQAEFELYLGVDDQLKVERELVDRTVEKGGLVGQVRRMLFGYRIKVANYRAERVPLTLLDLLPLSRHESVKVKLVRSDPPPGEGEMGELRWELGLAPAEEREVTFAFQVEMPPEAEVVGLP